MKISRWMVGGVLVVAIGGGYWYFSGRTATVSATNQLVRVAPGSITSSVKTTGKISPVQTSLVSFTRQGTITKLYKKLSEKVEAGAVIAEIDASDAYMDIRNAQISLDNANNNYNKLFSSSTEADKIRAKNTLEESKNSLKLLEAQYEDFLVSQKNDISESESQIALLTDKVALAESELEYTKQNLDTTKSDASNLERDIANSYITTEEIARFIPGSLSSIKDLIYIDNTTAERYGDLGSKNTYQKFQTEKLYRSISGSLASLEKSLAVSRSQSIHSLDEVLSLLTTSRSILQDMNTLTSEAVETYKNTPTGVPFSDRELETAQDDLRTLGSTISSKLTSINSTYTTLKNYGSDAVQALSNKNTIEAKTQSLKSAKNELDKAKRGLEALKSTQNTEKISRQNEIVRAKNSITLNEISYTELAKGPESTDLRSAQNSIASANINLEKARLALKEYQIIAPFDGVINDIPWKIGNTTASEGILVENKNAYEISLSLDQIDIVKVREGMNANILLDAFPTETYTGKITRVSEVPAETSGVVSYEAIVEVTINRSDIFSKMSATVEILTTEKNNILIIPTSAISSEGGKSYVNRAIDKEIYTKLLMQSRSGSMNTPPNFGSGGFRGNRSMSGGFERGNETLSGERNFGSMRGSGTTGTGRVSNMTNSGGVRGGNRRAVGASQNVTTTETIPTEKIEITIGISSDGKTEVVSGLSNGDVIVISTKTPSTGSRTSTPAGQNGARVPGIGGGRPPF